MNNDSRLSQDRLISLHRSVLDNDETGRETLAALLLPHLARILKQRFRSVDDVLVSDAIDDTVVHYLNHPDKFDPRRSRLDTFLAVIATRRVLNHLRHERRRAHAESVMARERDSSCLSVGPTPFGGACPELPDLDQIASGRELAFLKARIAGENRVVVLAKVLGLDGTAAERRKAVKQMWDRLRKRLLRLGQQSVL